MILVAFELAFILIPSYEKPDIKNFKIILKSLNKITFTIKNIDFNWKQLKIPLLCITDKYMKNQK